MTDVYDTPDWRGWVAAVRAAPDDDLVRLAAADWLDDRGEAERAELIRLMCRPLSPGRRRLSAAVRRRVRELVGRVYGRRYGRPDPARVAA